MERYTLVTVVFDLFGFRSFSIVPARLTRYSAWHEHIPFAMWLIEVQRPGLVVELGVHYGDSFCAMCQAVQELGLEAKCYGVDTWQGDPHAGNYGPEVLADLRNHHDPSYGGFSRLLQMTFDEASQHFADGSVDLLHIDGYHSYEAVSQDFMTWRAKLSEGGVVLFHDINVREGDFGVWKYWDELKANHPYVEFLHGHGLGVLGVGDEISPELKGLFAAGGESLTRIRNLFFRLGHELALKVRVESEAEHFGQELAARDDSLQDLRQELAARDDSLQDLGQELVARDESLHDLGQELAARDESLHDLGQELAARDENLHDLRNESAAREEELEGLREHVLAIEGSRGWRLLQFLWRLRSVVVPKGSWRERVTGWGSQRSSD